MPTRSLPWLEPDQAFPPVEHALNDPEGLLALGGDLSPQRLLQAYQHGIFPWFNQGNPIQWWSPDPRAVLFLDEFHISRRLQRQLKHCPFQVTFDQAFEAVMQGCASPRREQCETWITAEMMAAYAQLNAMGHGFSVECWLEGELVGGIYGVKLGNFHMGESMFSRAANASKIAMAHLVQRLKQANQALLDCQIINPHLQRLGAKTIRRSEYLQHLRREIPLSQLP